MQFQSNNRTAKPGAGRNTQTKANNNSDNDDNNNNVQAVLSIKLKESSSPQTFYIDHRGPKAIIMI